jgi:hypothetical protein
MENKSKEASFVETKSKEKNYMLFKVKIFCSFG